MSYAPPPNYELLVGGDGKPKLAWKLFFQQNYTGDLGTTWTPTFTNLTTVGAPAISGMYFKLGQFAVAEITVTPGVSTAAVAGTTYCDFPLVMQGNGICFAVAGGGGTISGMCDASTNRVYVPAWSAAFPITIFAFVRAN